MPDKRRCASVHRVERDRSLRGIPERHDLPPEEQGRGQGVVREMTGWRGLNGTVRRRKRAPEGIGPDVEPVGVLVLVHHRQHGPAVGVLRGSVDRPFQHVPHLRMLVGGDAFVVAKTSQHRLVRAQLIEVLLPEHLADAVREHAVRVRDSRDDAGNEIVLQLEDHLGTEGAVVGLRPQMCARARVHQLHRDAQHGARLPQRSLHHVPRAELLADRPHIGRLVRVAHRRTARDHSEVGEARQAGHDLLGQPLRQGRELGVGAAVLERQHGDPEPFVGARSARVGLDHRTRLGLRRARRHRRVDRHTAQAVGQVARRREAVRGALLQAALDHAAQGLRQVGPRLTDRRRRVAQDRRGQFGRRRAVERPLSAGHLVEDDAEREDVRAVIDGPARDLLRATCRAPCPSPRRRASAAPWRRLPRPARRRRRTWPGRSRAPSPGPSAVTITLAGLRSRWTMPFSCAAASASAMADGNRQGDDRPGRPPSGITRSSGWPSTSSIVRKCTPSACSTEWIVTMCG